MAGRQLLQAPQQRIAARGSGACRQVTAIQPGRVLAGPRPIDTGPIDTGPIDSCSICLSLIELA